MDKKVRILLLIISMMMALSAFTQSGGSLFYETTIKRTCEVYGAEMTSVKDCNDQETGIVFELTEEITHVKMHDTNGDVYKFESYDVKVLENNEKQVYIKTRDVTDNRLYQFLFDVENSTITMFSSDHPRVAILYFYSASWIE